MQTFMPYADFDQVARILDNKRLGKQRVEALQIIKTIENPNQRGWQNHPAVNMWRGYTAALRIYHNAMITEWIRRGFENTMPLYTTQRAVMPPWLQRVEVIESHRAMLWRKNETHYALFAEYAPRYEDYVWPA